jgi:serine/threonine protein kinase
VNDIDVFQGQNNQHIVNLIDSLEIYFPENKKYLILEYCKNGDLTKYIKFGKGLNLLHAKLLFKKILIAVKSVHKKMKKKCSKNFRVKIINI